MQLLKFNPMKAFYFFFFLLISSSLFAQLDEFCYLDIKLKPAQEKMVYAKYYDKARADIKVELIEYSFDGGKTDFGKTYKAEYNKKKDLWQIRVPKGWYLLRSKHIGFKAVKQILEVKKMKEEVESRLELEGELPYTYKDGSTYTYIKGGIEFSETIIVFFKSGTPEENKGFLEETFAAEKVQKLKYSNAFFLTLNLKNQEPLPEVLIRKSMGDVPLHEGFYFGESITKAIETLLNNPNVDYANPSFIVPKSAPTELKLVDYGSVGGMIADFQNQKPEQPKFLNLDDFEKSDALKNKLLQQLEE
jgi:hypothetical protein